MNIRKKERIVLLGMMSRHPQAGMVWLTVQYLVGFERLGYEVFYVEAHGCNPRTFGSREGDNSVEAASFIDRVMRRFGLENRWAFQALHSDGSCYGMSEGKLSDLYRSAALLINLHGGTTPLPEHVNSASLVYLGTDPVTTEIKLHKGDSETVELLSQHSILFTWAENYGNVDCRLPKSEQFQFKPTRQPIVLDFWKRRSNGNGRAFTTVGSWRQLWREIEFKGEVYHWSKHFEFMKFLALPERTGECLELALANCPDPDRRTLEAKGWRVKDALEVSDDLDTYCEYIANSRGEFTVAKDQNVRLRSGWFSDRSASYLASGRPVITQETGFSNYLPTGKGLFSFSTMEEVEAAIQTINQDYASQCRSASEIAADYFDYRVVLPRMLKESGL